MGKIIYSDNHDVFSRSCVSRGYDLDASPSNKQHVIDTISTGLINDVLDYLNSGGRSDNIRPELNGSIVKKKPVAMNFDSTKAMIPSTTFNDDESLVKPRSKRNSNSDVQLPVTLPLVVEPESIESSVVRSDVIIDKISYTCIEERKELDFISILNIVLGCIAYPFQRMSIEAYITTIYLKDNKCPSQESIDKIIGVFSMIDSSINLIFSLFKQFSPLSIMQNIICPTMKMLIDSYAGREINQADEFF